MNGRRLFYTVAFNVNQLPEGVHAEDLEGFLANIVAAGLSEYQDKIAPLSGVDASSSALEVAVSFDIERAPYKFAV